MNTEKIRQAAYKTIIENEDSFFEAEDKLPLALAAVVVLEQVPELLATVTQATAKGALEAAAETDTTGGGEDTYDKWQEAFTSRLKAGVEVDELLKALAFASRYVEEIAKAAARKAGKLDGNFGAKFGRN